LKEPLNIGFPMLYRALTTSQEPWEELGHGRNYQQSGEADANPSRR
jgi:hypothetical protein